MSDCEKQEGVRGEISRRRFLSITGLTFFSVLTACKGIKEPDLEPQPSKAVETVEKNEIILGNVRFFLENPSSMSKEKKIELFETMSRAYNKLEGYLGKDAMTHPESISVPIEYGAISEVWDGDALGRVVMSEEGGRTTEDGIELLERLRPIKLQLKSIVEDNIAHEFVHLFAQGTALFSESFFEGHAYAIQSTLYPSSRDETLANLFAEDDINEFFDYGLDHNQYDLSLKGGIQSPLLRRLALVKWEKEWKEFLNIEPDFLRNFYTELARQKNEGKKSFSKSDLIGIGNGVSNAFVDWYKNAECFKDIGESEPKQRFLARLIKDKRLLFVGAFDAHPKVTGGGQYTPQFLSPIAIGKLQLKVLGDDGVTQELIVNNWDNYSALAEIPEEFVNGSEFQVQIVE